MATFTEDRGLHVDPQGEVVRAGGLNRSAAVLAVAATTFTVQDPDHLHYTAFEGGAVTVVAAGASAAPGPYAFDPGGGFGVDAVAGALATALQGDDSYAQIELGAGEAEAFPDTEGYLVLAWGYANQAGPLRYHGRLSDSILAVDPGFVVPRDLPVGTRVHLLFSRAPYVPAASAVGLFWLTDSPSGREAARALVEAASAAGIELAIETRYPGDRGLGAEGWPTHDSYKLSDIVPAFAGNNQDAEVSRARG